MAKALAVRVTERNDFLNQLMAELEELQKSVVTDPVLIDLVVAATLASHLQVQYLKKPTFERSEVDFRKCFAYVEVVGSKAEEFARSDNERLALVCILLKQIVESALDAFNTSLRADEKENPQRMLHANSQNDEVVDEIVDSDPFVAVDPTATAGQAVPPAPDDPDKTKNYG